MLKRFYELRHEIADFMQIKDKPLSELSDPKWICDLAFLVDLTGYLNDLNLKLQKQGKLVNDLYVQPFESVSEQNPLVGSTDAV